MATPYGFQASPYSAAMAVLMEFSALKFAFRDIVLHDSAGIVGYGEVDRLLR